MFLLVIYLGNSVRQRTRSALGKAAAGHRTRKRDSEHVRPAREEREKKDGEEGGTQGTLGQEVTGSSLKLSSYRQAVSHWGRAHRETRGEEELLCFGVREKSL